MQIRRLVCLANSNKGKDSYCFAGVDAVSHEWIRPIGSGWEGALLESEEAYEDGTLPKLLDVVDVPLQKARPGPGQPENWTIDATSWWTRAKRLKAPEATVLLDAIAETGPVLGNRGKALTPEKMARLTSSLAVIKPENPTWRKSETGGIYVRCEHADRELEFKVTDPVFCSEFDDYEPGEYHDDDDLETFLVLSVTATASNGWHTKLVAGVIRL